MQEQGKGAAEGEQQEEGFTHLVVSSIFAANFHRKVLHFRRLLVNSCPPWLAVSVLFWGTVLQAVLCQRSCGKRADFADQKICR